MFRLKNKTVTITHKDLTITTVADEKAYDGTITSEGTPTADGIVKYDTISILKQIFANKNAGTKDMELDDDYTIIDADNADTKGNYNIIVDKAQGTINKKDLTISAVTDTKTYDWYHCQQ